MNMAEFEGGFKELARVLTGFPDAVAILRGDEKHPLLAGIVLFFDTRFGTLVAAEVKGLPEKAGCEHSFFGFHIHEGAGCGGEDFAETGGHLNPENCPHPAHAGDMPPLLAGTGGYAVSVSLLPWASAQLLIGRTVVIHSSADDFKTQPTGAAGEKIACGIIAQI